MSAPIKKNVVASPASHAAAPPAAGTAVARVTPSLAAAVVDVPEAPTTQLQQLHHLAHAHADVLVRQLAKTSRAQTTHAVRQALRWAAGERARAIACERSRAATIIKQLRAGMQQEVQRSLAAAAASHAAALQSLLDDHTAATAELTASHARELQQAREDAVQFALLQVDAVRAALAAGTPAAAATGEHPSPTAAAGGARAGTGTPAGLLQPLPSCGYDIAVAAPSSTEPAVPEVAADGDRVAADRAAFLRCISEQLQAVDRPADRLRPSVPTVTPPSTTVATAALPPHARRDPLASTRQQQVAFKKAKKASVASILSAAVTVPQSSAPAPADLPSTAPATSTSTAPATSTPRPSITVPPPSIASTARKPLLHGVVTSASPDAASPAVVVVPHCPPNTPVATRSAITADSDAPNTATGVTATASATTHVASAAARQRAASVLIFSPPPRMTKRAKLAAAKSHVLAPLAPASSSGSANTNSPAAIPATAPVLAIGPLPYVAAASGDPAKAIWAGALIQRPKPRKAVKAATAAGPSTLLLLPALLAPAATTTTGSAKAVVDARPALSTAAHQLEGAVLDAPPLLAPTRTTGLCSIPEAFPLTLDAPTAAAGAGTAASAEAVADAVDAATAGSAKTPASAATDVPAASSVPADGSAPAASGTPAPAPAGANPATVTDFVSTLLRWAVSPSGFSSRVFF